MLQYERDLKVPYYLRFDPEKQDLTLFRHNKRKFVAVKPNAAGRLAISELDLEVGLMDGWTRFWYKGELLPLPANLQRDLGEVRQRLAAATEQLDRKQQALQAAHEEIERLKSQLARTKLPRSNGK